MTTHRSPKTTTTRDQCMMTTRHVRKTHSYSSTSVLCGYRKDSMCVTCAAPAHIRYIAAPNANRLRTNTQQRCAPTVLAIKENEENIICTCFINSNIHVRRRRRQRQCADRMPIRACIVCSLLLVNMFEPSASFACLRSFQKRIEAASRPQ